MTEKIKKLIFLSLGADFVASLLFIFSLQISQLPLIICFYCIAVFLVISSLLACFNNYKRYKVKILLFMDLIDLLLIIVYSVVLYSKI